MTKRSKKTETTGFEVTLEQIDQMAEDVEAGGDGLYHVVSKNGVFGEIEVIDGGKIVHKINGKAPEYFGLNNEALTVKEYLRCERGTKIGVQKNTPEAAATATEADSEPREENQTNTSITKKQNIRKPIVRTLRFDLSADEIEAKCAGISKKSRARAELEAEFARVRTDYKGRIERMENEIVADLRAVEDRAEYREVECDEVHDFESRMVGFEFEGEIYEQREMTPSERQMTFEEVF